MAGYSIMWMILFKVLLATTIVLVISSGVRSQDPPKCPGTCSQFRDCDARCGFIGYGARKMHEANCVVAPLIFNSSLSSDLTRSGCNQTIYSFNNIATSCL
ncbi:hypothetical protein ACSQ67_024419 [Phaseolus vulgaris]